MIYVLCAPLSTRPECMIHTTIYFFAQLSSLSAFDKIGR